MSAIREPKKWRGLCVIAEYTPKYVLSYRGDQHIEFVVGGETYSVQMNDSRYRIFAQSLSCCECGLTGSVMRLEYCRHPRGLVEPHFNLYAINNGTLVLMTQDHIIPRSKGGSDEDSNLRTMCSPCNAKKGHKLLSDGAERIRAKRRDTLLNYLRNVIEGTGSRNEAEALLLAVIDDDKVTARWKLAAEKAGWEEKAMAANA